MCGEAFVRLGFLCGLSVAGFGYVVRLQRKLVSEVGRCGNANAGGEYPDICGDI
jgi:hypothetical protein